MADMAVVQHNNEPVLVTLQKSVTIQKDCR